jgi:hypothetical protein
MPKACRFETKDLRRSLFCCPAGDFAPTGRDMSARGGAKRNPWSSRSFSCRPKGARQVTRVHRTGFRASLGKWLALPRFVSPRWGEEEIIMTSTRGSAALHPWLACLAPLGRRGNNRTSTRGSAALHPWLACPAPLGRFWLACPAPLGRPCSIRDVMHY